QLKRFWISEIYEVEYTKRAIEIIRLRRSRKRRTLPEKGKREKENTVSIGYRLLIAILIVRGYNITHGPLF
ncbi:hypothetical protein, partial [Sediminispirochaeta bajacaliforniensis]|uniref:hypothetical protein n=1 Tax=Sediminispirochaeta bajacaliforniensis TaxID=148 RepID=UPI001B7FAC64